MISFPDETPAEGEAMPVEEILSRLERIELVLEQIASERETKEMYSTSEVAELLGRAEFTVREWCRNGRIYAEKRLSGRGSSREWAIAHEELQRIRNEGLLPL